MLSPPIKTGLFALRLQLKSLSFEDALLPSLLALLAPLSLGAAGSSVPGALGATTPNGFQSQDQQMGKGGPDAATAADVNGGGSFAHSRSPFSSVERGEQIDGRHGRIEGGGAGGLPSSTGGDGDKEIARGRGESAGGLLRLDGLQSDLGKGTPLLHWPLLESLR